jgi:hypothetical protein
VHRPPKPLEILIYGNSSSRAIAAVSKDDFSSTLETVGHKVTKCDDAKSCNTVLATGRFDVVLADPSDAANLKASNASGILPVAIKPNKEELKLLKDQYATAFDASRDALRLLPLLSKAMKAAR